VKISLKKINGKLAHVVTENRMATILAKLCQTINRNDLIPFAVGLGLGIDFAVIITLFSML
jgi:hypothetical protein